MKNQEQKQKVSVAGVLLFREKVLFVRRSKEEGFLPGVYEIPGGKVMFGESPEETIVREFKEETDVNVIPGELLHIRSYMSKEGEQHNIEVFFSVRTNDAEPEVVLSKEHEEYLWVSAEESEQLGLGDSDPVLQVVKRFFASRKAG
jgi:8-oxo-dGTP diphosphatase